MKYLFCFSFITIIIILLLFIACVSNGTKSLADSLYKDSVMKDSIAKVEYAIDDSIAKADSIATAEAAAKKGGKKYGSTYSKKFHSFPIPIPKPTTFEALPNRFFSKCYTLNDVDMTISNAIHNAGYFNKSYYYVPEGFALVTQLEMIDEDGTPKKENERWFLNRYKSKFSISSYIRALFKANVGYYRCIVFIISREQFASSTKAPSRTEANNWIIFGFGTLPKEISEIPNINYYYTAYVYEFKKPENSEAFLLDNGIPCRQHLIKAKIWEKFNFK